jgi:epoxide hydrolase-like predicted phosphatase
MNNNIKAICFDLDGVYFTPRGKESFIRALVDEFGGDAVQVAHMMTKSEAMRALVTGKLEPNKFWNILRAETGITASDEELTVRWILDYEIDAEVAEVVRRARVAGYKTCVCTNNNPIRLPALEARFGFMKDFDVVIASYEVGYTKPSREIFEVLLERVEVAPGELVYADDNPDRLQGARDLGITVFVYETFPQYIEELRRLGVKV